MTFRDVAAKLGMNLKTVQWQTKRLNIGTVRIRGTRQYREFDDVDVDRLRDVNTVPAGMFNTEQVAAELGLSQPSVRAWAERADISMFPPFYERYLFTTDDIERIRRTRRENQIAVGEESTGRIRQTRPTSYQTPEYLYAAGKRLHAAFKAKLEQRLLRPRHDKLDDHLFEI